MKYLSSVVFMLVMFACGNKAPKQPADQNEVVKAQVNQSPQSSLTACELLNEDVIKQYYPGASAFKKDTKNDSYELCTYLFEVSGVNQYAGLTISRGGGYEKKLDSSVKYFPQKEEVDGFENKAYYIPATGQISTWIGDDLVHMSVTVKGSGDKAMAITMTKDILAKMK